MRLLVIVFVLFLIAVPVLAQDPTPTPIFIPEADMYDALGDADASLGELPGDLTQSNGTPLLPTLNLTELIGYARWITSPAAADEIFGVFAPVVTPLGLLLAVRFALGGIYFIVYAAIYLIRWVIWIFKMLLMLVNSLGALINLAGGLVGKGLSWLFGRLLGG